MDERRIKQMSKKISMLALAGAFVVGVAACGGGGGSGGSSSTSSSSVSGTPTKGAFTTCTAVISQVDPTDTVDGLSDTNYKEATCTDGSYSGTVSWTGLSVVEVYGTYYDEENDTTVTLAKGAGLKATASLSTTTAQTVHPNVFSDASASLTIDSVKTGGYSSDQLDALATSSDSSVADAIGVTLGSGESFGGLDLSASSLSGTAGEVMTKQQGLMKTFKDGGGSSSSLLSELTSIMKSAVNNGANVDSQLVTYAGSNASFSYTSGNLATNIDARATSPKARTSGGTAPTYSDTDKATYQAKAATIAVTNGLSCVSSQGAANTVNVGGTEVTFASDGTVNNGTAVTVSSRNDVTFTCNVTAYTSSDGTTAAARSWSGKTFGFYIDGTSSWDSRSITATLDNVDVSIGATSGSDTTPSSVSVSITSGAALVYKGTNSAGTAISGTISNTIADATGSTSSSVISASGNALTINATALLSQINTRVGRSNRFVYASGNFTYSIGFGVPVGYASGTTLNNRFPDSSSDTIVGPTVNGKLTIQ